MLVIKTTRKSLLENSCSAPEMIQNVEYSRRISKRMRSRSKLSEIDEYIENGGTDRWMRDAGRADRTRGRCYTKGRMFRAKKGLTIIKTVRGILRYKKIVKA